MTRSREASFCGLGCSLRCFLGLMGEGGASVAKAEKGLRSSTARQYRAVHRKPSPINYLSPTYGLGR